MKTAVARTAPKEFEMCIAFHYYTYPFTYSLLTLSRLDFAL